MKIFIIVVALILGLFLVACSSPSQPGPPTTGVFPTLDLNAPQGRPGLAPAQPASQVELKVVVMAEVWTRITADGKVVWEGQLAQGAEHQWQGREIRVRASNGAALLLTPNGLPSEFLGRLGKPSEKVLRLVDGRIYVEIIDPPT